LLEPARANVAAAVWRRGRGGGRGRRVGGGGRWRWRCGYSHGLYRAIISLQSHQL